MDPDYFQKLAEQLANLQPIAHPALAPLLPVGTVVSGSGGGDSGMAPASAVGGGGGLLPMPTTTIRPVGAFDAPPASSLLPATSSNPGPSTSLVTSTGDPLQTVGDATGLRTTRVVGDIGRALGKGLAQGVGNIVGGPLVGGAVGKLVGGAMTPDIPARNSMLGRAINSPLDLVAPYAPTNAGGFGLLDPYYSSFLPGLSGDPLESYYEQLIDPNDPMLSIGNSMAYIPV